MIYWSDIISDLEEKTKHLFHLQRKPKTLSAQVNECVHLLYFRANTPAWTETHSAYTHSYIRAGRHTDKLIYMHKDHRTSGTARQTDQKTNTQTRE